MDLKFRVAPLKEQEQVSAMVVSRGLGPVDARNEMISRLMLSRLEDKNDYYKIVTLSDEEQFNCIKQLIIHVAQMKLLGSFSEN